MCVKDTGLNQNRNKVHNRSLILKMIKQHPGITRIELSRMSGLTKTAITRIVNMFMDAGVIEEKSDEKIRNKGLIFSGGRIFSISIYLGRLSISGALFDINGTLLMEKRLPVGVKFYGNDCLPEDSLKLINLIMAESGINKDLIIAIGIAAPGAVTAGKGIVFNRSFLTEGENQQVPFNWGKIQLVEYLKEKTNLPVFIDNNSNLSALAEGWFGKGVGVKNFVQYSIGLGIGGGAVIDGQLFRGNDNIVCEIGHTTVDINGERCFCGNRGCLETVAGFKCIVEKYDDMEVSPCDEEYLQKRLQEIFKKAEGGEAKAVSVLKAHTEILGVGAVTLINMYSPEKVIVSINDLDDISLEIILKDLELYIRRNAYQVISDNVKLEISSLGPNIHHYGAYALILENLFSLLSDRMDVS